MLTISMDTVGWIIVKAREVDAKAADTGVGEPMDDDRHVLLARGEVDAGVQEIRSWIADLTETQAAELTALMWLGRGDGAAEAFSDLVDQARASRSTPTADYLLGEPLLADHLEEGLALLGVAPAEVEATLR